MGIRSLLSPRHERADLHGSPAVPAPADRFGEGGPSRRWTGSTQGEAGPPPSSPVLPPHGEGREAARVQNLLATASGPRSKWRVLEAHRGFSSLKRQQACGLDAQHSKVVVGRSDGRVSFAGARACNLRTCINCGPRIQALYRERIKNTVTKARSEGMSVLFLTLTIRHTSDDDLDPMLAAEAAAWRGLTSGGWWVRLCRDFGLEGFVRVVECTYGDHGFHPHIHVLLFRDPALADHHDTAELRKRLVHRWTLLVGATAYTASAVGQDLREADDRDVDSLSGYFTKQHSANGLSWEMTGSGSKFTRRTLSPDQLLAAATLGDSSSERAYRRYEQGTKARRMIDFSRRLKARFELLPLGSVDAQIRDSTPVGNDRMVEVQADEWSELTRRPHLVAEVAEMIEGGCDGFAVYRHLTEHGIRCTLHVTPDAPPGPLRYADGAPADDGYPDALPF